MVKPECEEFPNLMKRQKKTRLVFVSCLIASKQNQLAQGKTILEIKSKLLKENKKATLFYIAVCQELTYLLSSFFFFFYILSGY